MTAPNEPQAPGTGTGHIDSLFPEAGTGVVEPPAPGDTGSQTPASEPPAATSPVETAAEGESTDDHRSDAQLGREAARYRSRLRETEAALTQAQQAHQAAEDTLTRQRQAIIDATLTAAKLDPALLVAAGHGAADFVGEDGLLDIGKLGEATREAMARFNVAPRSTGPTPNPQQGQSSGALTPRTLGQFLHDA